MSARGHVDSGLPSRASVRRADKHFDGKVLELSERIDVILDGITLDECASWDVENGIITRHHRTNKGELILDERGAPAFEELRGVVEVRWRKGQAA